MSNNDSMCFKCMKDAGHNPRDEGAHTARTKVCEGCGELKPILASRHWVLNSEPTK